MASILGFFRGSARLASLGSGATFPHVRAARGRQDLTLTPPSPVVCARAPAAPAALAALPRAAAAAALPAAAPGAGARFDSTKRKRAKMMNKHKYEKLKKRMRSLMAKNVRGSK